MLFGKKIIALLLMTIIDRAGIPLSFITGIYLLKENRELIPIFFLLATFMGVLGDVIMYYFGIYYANKKDNNLLLSGAGIKNKIIKKSKFIYDNPILWIYASKAFNYINQLIPIALGINKFSKTKFLLNTVLANLIWFGLFYFLANNWLVYLAENGKTIGFITGIAGILIIYLGLKFYEKKTKPKE